MQTIGMFMDGISFDEILQSQDKNASPLTKWLPGITTRKGLEKLVRRFYDCQCLPMTVEDIIGRKVTTATPTTDEERSRLMKLVANRLPIKQGENFIAAKKIPLSELIKIRAWRTAQKRKNASRSPTG